MRFRVLGSTQLKVSVIGLGTWQLGGEWGHQYTQAEADALLDTAADNGINLIDTAECYGDHLSERLIGDYLSRRDRTKWVVATKFGHRFNRFMDRTEAFSPLEVAKQLDASLRALKIETIDLYQFHSGSDLLFENQELWTFLLQQKALGKVRHIGISILGKSSELQAQQAKLVGAEALQVVYNRLDRRPEELYFPSAKRDNLGVLARVPLASGLLSGKYKAGATFQSGDVRSTFDPAKIQADLHAVENLKQTEIPAGVPMHRWALAWCLQNPVVTAVIPGAKNPEQVAENAAAADLLAQP